MDRLLVGIGAVVIIIAALFGFKYFKDQKNGKEEAKQFLKELEEQMYLIIIQCINSIDFHSFNNFEEYEKQVLAIVYQGCWDFVDKKMAEADNKDLLSAIAKKVLTQEYVERFIDEILVKREVNETMLNMYGADAIANMDNSEEEKLTAEFSDNDQYFTEEATIEDLPPVEEVEHTEEEIEALNPQTDEGDDLEDAVEEVTDRIIKITNRAGKVMYYLEDGVTGKRKQVSKQFALESDLEIVDKYNK